MLSILLSTWSGALHNGVLLFICFLGCWYLFSYSAVVYSRQYFHHIDGSYSSGYYNRENLRKERRKERREIAIGWTIGIVLGGTLLILMIILAFVQSELVFAAQIFSISILLLSTAVAWSLYWVKELWGEPGPPMGSNYEDVEARRKWEEQQQQRAIEHRRQQEQRRIANQTEREQRRRANQIARERRVPEKAIAEGRLAEALDLFMKSHQYDAILENLYQSIPPQWGVEPHVREAANELFLLENGLVYARRAKVRPAIVAKMGQETDKAATALWLTVERLASAGGQNVFTKDVEAGVQRQRDNLVRLRAALVETREALTVVTLSSTDQGAINKADDGLRKLADAVRILSG